MTGQEFKRIREKLGFSQDQLALVLGLSGKKAVSNIEIGFRNPSRLIAAIMHVFVRLPEKRSIELRNLLLEISKQQIKESRGSR